MDRFRKFMNTLEQTAADQEKALKAESRDDADLVTTGARPMLSIDPGAVALYTRPDAMDLLAATVHKLDTFLDQQITGIPGQPGNEQWPELAFQVRTVGDTGLYIAGNAHRQKLTLHNSGPDTVYICNENAFDVLAGFPVLTGAAFVLEVPTAFKLMCSMGKTAAVSIIEQSQ